MSVGGYDNKAMIIRETHSKRVSSRTLNKCMLSRFVLWEGRRGNRSETIENFKRTVSLCVRDEQIYEILIEYADRYFISFHILVPLRSFSLCSCVTILRLLVLV